MTRRPSETLGAALLLCAATLGIFHRWLFDGQSLYWGDTGLYFTPMLQFLRGQLTHGHLPLWNPAIFSGLPFVGNPQTWPLYPGTLLLPLLPASAFLTINCVLHIFLAGLFTFLWLHNGHRRLPLAPALLGAIGLMFGGFLVSKAQYPNMLQALAYVPLVLWRTETLVETPTLRASALLGLALGLQILAAHAQVTLYTLYLALFVGLFRLVLLPTRRLWPLLRATFTAGTLALALACGQWLPLLAARPETARQSLPLSVVNRLHLSPLEWTNFALPWRYGTPLHGNYTGPSAFWETASYAGLFTLLLALYFVLTRLPRSAPFRPEAAFWTAIFLGSVWLSFGAQDVAFRLAYAVVPGFTFFHDPARLLLGASVALPVLAAFGLQSLSELLARRHASLVWVPAAIILLTIVDTGAFDNSLYPLLPTIQLENPAASPVAAALRADPILASGSGRLLTLDDINADNQFLDWTDFRPPPHYLGRLSSTMLPNLPQSLGLNNLGGYEPLALRSGGTLPVLAIELLALQTAARPARPDLAAKTASFLGAMSVRTLLTYRPPPAPHLPGFTPTLTWQDGPNQGTVYLCAAFVPRARRCTSWRFVHVPITPADAARAWLAPTAPPDFLDQPWLDGDGPPASTPPTPPQPLTVLRDTPDRVTLVVPAASAATLALLADAEFPGWHAALDGTPIPLRRADGVYRAVLLPPSAAPQTLDFRFRPEAFAVGFYITGLAVVFLAASSTVSFIRRQTT